MSWKNDIFRYFTGLIILSLIFFGFWVMVPLNLAMLLWFLSLYSLVYLPFIFAYRRAPRKRANKEEERIIVANDIAHFREVVDKAMNQKAIAQRNVEFRVLNVLVVDLSIKHNLPEIVVRRNLDNEKFMVNLMGERGKIAKKMYERRHDMKTPLGKNEFLREINILMEAMK